MGVTIPIFGIPTFFSVWSLVMIALFAWLGVFYIGKQFPRANNHKPSLRAMAILAALIAVLSVVLHEIAHAIVAFAVGDPIVGAGITGWGAWVEPSIATSDLPGWKQVLIALAGPVTNLIIGALFAIPVYHLPESLHENTLQYISYINLNLGKFNLLPFFILDGGKLVDGLSRMMSDDSTWRFVWWIIYFFAMYFLILKYKPIKDLEERLETL